MAGQDPALQLAGAGRKAVAPAHRCGPRAPRGSCRCHAARPEHKFQAGSAAQSPTSPQNRCGPHPPPRFPPSKEAKQGKRGAQEQGHQAESDVRGSPRGLAAGLPSASRPQPLPIHSGVLRSKWDGAGTPVSGWPGPHVRCRRWWRAPCAPPRQPCRPPQRPGPAGSPTGAGSAPDGTGHGWCSSSWHGHDAGVPAAEGCREV